jgi:hypothetical protein
MRLHRLADDQKLGFLKKPGFSRGFGWCVLALGAFLPSSVLAQFPQPRLQHVMPPGGQAGTNVDVTLAGSNLEGVNALWFDHPGLRAFHLKDATFRVAIAPGTPTGYHDVRAVGPLGVSNARVFAVGDRPQRREAEPNNTPEQASAIGINEVAIGAIEPTDVDCFAFEGQRGQRLFLEIEAQRIDSKLDPILRVEDPSGHQIAESRDEPSPDHVLDLTLPSDGRYVIKLHDVIYSGSPEHFYRLSLREGPHLDAITPAVAAPGVPTTFTLLGRNIGGTALPDLRIDGQPVEKKEITLTVPLAREPDPSLPDTEFLFSSAADRRGLLYREPGPNGPSNPVFIAAATEPVLLEHEPNDDAEHAQMINLPCDIAGAFGKVSDFDVYRFSAKKGQVWWIEAMAERLGSPADPSFVIQRVVEKGPAQDLATGDDRPEPAPNVLFPFSRASVDAELRWQVPEDGLYQIIINDLNNVQRGDARFTYRLTIRPERPDFRLFALTANPMQEGALNLRAGGRASATVVVWRLDGFDAPIRVAARNLPPGVACEPVIIGPGQFQTPLVFHAAEGATASAAVVEIAGQALSGDRKELLDYRPGVSIFRPEMTHPALPGSDLGPPGNANGQILAPPMRVARGFVLAVRAGSPFALTAKPESAAVALKDSFELTVEVARHPGFTEAVQLNVTDLPPNMGGASGTIAKDKTSTTLKLTVPENVTPGMYTILVRGTGPFPFSADPNAKEKPNINVNEPSNPITLIIRR